MRVPTEQRLRQWLADHLQNLRAWTDGATGRVSDPFESHQHDVRVTGESYNPATALVVAAAATRQGDLDAAALPAGYCSRILALLTDENTPPFTALFLQYFGLLAGEDLRTLAARDNPPLPTEQVEQFLATLAAYIDRLDTPINANCAAMQAGVQMLRHLLTGRADWQRCRQRLDLVAAQQSGSGFINDDLAGPSQPVAYHMFCVYLLAAATARLRRAATVPPEAEETLRCAETIVTRGYAWMGHLLANDGMFAQFGRSRYHPFSQAAGVALLAAAGIDAEDACVRRYLQWMQQYRLPVGGTGAPAFAVTPNLCPQALRVGFEPYGMVAVYNNLAMTILLDAHAWWTGELPPLAGAADAKRAFFNAARERGCHADAAVGLVRLRSRAGFVLVNLMTDYRGTTPLGSLVHLRLGDDLHERAAPPPFWADPRVQSDAAQTSVWEGPLLCESAKDVCGPAHPPPFLMQARTLECRSGPSSLLLRCTGPGADWSKSIVLEPGVLQIAWQVAIAMPGKTLFTVVPCLLWDGQFETQFRFDGPHVLAMAADRTWRLTIQDSQAQPLPGTWFLSPHRSPLSTSGMTGRLLFPLTTATTPSHLLAWTLRIEAM